MSRRQLDHMTSKGLVVIGPRVHQGDVPTNQIEASVSQLESARADWRSAVCELL